MRSSVYLPEASSFYNRTNSTLRTTGCSFRNLSENQLLLSYAGRIPPWSWTFWITLNRQHIETVAAEEATVGSSAGRRKVRDKERTVWFLTLGFAIQKYIFNYSPASIRPFVKKPNVSVCAISGQIVHKDLNFTSYVMSDECFMNAIELKDLILFSFFSKMS